MELKQQVFVNVNDAGYPEVIDQMTTDGKGLYSGQTIEEIRQRYPKIELRDFDAVIEQQEAHLRTAPEMISEDQFNDALEMLPPDNWVRTPAGESFAFSERYSGRMTTIYARLGRTYWKFIDVASLGHMAIMERIGAEVKRRVPA